MRRYFEGADLSKLLRLPRWLDAVTGHDLVAYPLHASFGSALNLLGAPPRVAALEWMKAAAHARSAAAVARVAAGLAEAQRRAGQNDLEPMLRAAVVDQVTRQGRDVKMRRRQLEAMASAGLCSHDADAEATATGNDAHVLATSAQRKARSATTGR
jgi:hypothetical protein